MLTRQRQEKILELLERQGSVTVTELKDILNASESTIRRDIVALDRENKLTKVFGGAVASEQPVTTYEYTVAQKEDLNKEEKLKIARYAASLIEPEDFIYLDAGTTTAHMIDYINHSMLQSATFVTNAVAHAQLLAAQDAKVVLIGGELKATTEAVVGSLAVEAVRKYHFSKGFFGTNGISKKSGCTTPDANEAMIKKAAMEQCKKAYVLSDSTKFGNVSSVTFAPFYGTTFLTEKIVPGFEECENITVVED